MKSIESIMTRLIDQHGVKIVYGTIIVLVLFGAYQFHQEETYKASYIGGGLEGCVNYVINQEDFSKGDKLSRDKRMKAKVTKYCKKLQREWE